MSRKPRVQRTPEEKWQIVLEVGEDWVWGAPKEEAHKMYQLYRSAGGNFIDTANLYTNGTSETLVGEFMRDHRQEIVLGSCDVPSTPMHSEETTRMPPAISARAWCRPWRAPYDA